MDPTSQKAKDIFVSLVEGVPEAAWEERADEACHGDETLRQRVRVLLSAHARPDSRLDQPAVEFPVTIPSPRPITEKPGTQIGPYKLLQQIGEGGFGVVYMAEQTAPVRRKVALKIVKPGMDTKEVVTRFEAERQAMALIDHPNVAKVLDAGATKSGRPYFVMELVYGVPITEFCDDQKLSNNQRLKLFVDVCRAIQHAHHKGIIHRDVKPSNVMVTMHDDKPVPKVIDFGVSKALSQQLTEKTLFTAYGQMVGTPLYMSPEQAQLSGLDVDTRSDVYSLGVLLYELLTGTTPFDKDTIKQAGYDEIRRLIREEEPPRPSARVSTLAAEALSTVCVRRQIDTRQLSQSLRGELDWIVMKALEKDRSRRYETAHDLASDINRYLSDQPVIACPPSVTYRLGKSFRRNRVAFATASMVALALVFGLAGTAWEAVRANSERDQAIAAKQLARDRLGRAQKAEGEARQLQKQAEQRSKEVTRLLAASDVDRAQALCEQGEIGRGLLWFARSLQETPADSVDLQRVIRTNIAAWYHRLHPLSMVLQQPGETVAVAFHPDGTHVLTGCKDGTLQLWDASTGELIRKSTAHAAWAQVTWDLPFDGAAFHPNGSKILTASNERTAQLWDARTLDPIGEPIAHSPPGQNLPAHDRVRLVAFSPDGTCFVTADRHTIRQWDTATREQVGDAFARGAARAVRYCPSGLYAVIHTTNTRVQLWNVSQDRPVGPQVFHPNLFAVAISPDGSLLATGDGGGRIKLWLAKSGEPILPPLNHPGVVWRLEFSPDGSQLLSGGGTRSSVLWDVATGTPIGAPLRERSSVRTIAFHPTGARVVTGGEDGSVRLWDLGPDESVGRAIGHSDPVMAAGYSIDGLRILTESHGRCQLRDALTGKAIGPAFSPDNDATFKLLGRRLPRAGTAHLTFSPDGAQLLIRTDCPELRDVVTGRAIGAPYAWFTGRGMRGAAFSPDGTRILVGDTDGPGQLWDTWSLAPIGPPLRYRASSVAFSPDGSRFVTGSFDGTTQIWDTATLQAIGEPWIHQSEVKALAWSPDGGFLLVGFADGTARLWDMETLTPVGVPLHHGNVLSSVAFSPDGSRLLTCSLDETAQLWDRSTGQPIGPTIRHCLGYPVGCFSPNGSEILITGFDGPPRVWKAPPGPLTTTDAQRITTWAEVVTGLNLDQRGGIDALDGPAWRQHHERLHELGGPPDPARLPTPCSQTKRSRSIEWALEGRHQAEQGCWDQAQATFAKVLQDNASNLTLHYQIAAWACLLAEEQLDAAEYECCEQLSLYAASILEQLLNRFPENRDRSAFVGCYVLRERALRSMGRVEEANGVRGKIIAMLPKDPSDRHNLARMWVHEANLLDQWSQPTRSLKQQLACAATLLQAEIDEAQRQASLKRLLPQAQLLLGRVHAIAGRFDEAKARYQRLLENYPDYYWAHVRLSQLLLSQPHLRADDVQSALRHARAAMDAIPENENVLATFGIACFRAGDYATAVEALESARKNAIQTGYTIRSCYLAMAYWHLGQREQAADTYRQVTDTIDWCGLNSDTIRRLDAETAQLLVVRPGDELDARH